MRVYILIEEIDNGRCVESEIYGVYTSRERAEELRSELEESAESSMNVIEYRIIEEELIT